MQNQLRYIDKPDSAEYLYCGNHVRKLALIIAGVVFVLELIVVPFNFFIGKEKNGKLYWDSYIGSSISLVLVLTVCICVFVADKKKKPGLYLPLIVYFIFQIIGCIIFTFLYFIVSFNPDLREHVLNFPHYEGSGKTGRVIFTVILIVCSVVFIALLTIACKILISARKYMMNKTGQDTEVKQRSYI